MKRWLFSHAGEGSGHCLMVPRRLRVYLLLLAFVSLFILAYLTLSSENPYQITDHVNALLDSYRKRGRVALRLEQNECPPIYGKILVFLIYVQSSLDKGYYGVALESLRCYLKGRDYEFAMVDIEKDERVQEACGHHQQLFFKKHCAAAEYLRDADWLLVLDADTGVVNPCHCIEQWIDDRVNLIFYERFFNWEIASGNYLVSWPALFLTATGIQARNSNFTWTFLKKWAEWEFHQPSNWNGADNGVLQLHILQTVLPDAQQEIKNCDDIWRTGKDYDTYMAYVVCVKMALGATRLWPEKIRIYRRAHGWVRDAFLTTDQWGPSDFMLHGWKRSQIGEEGWDSPFTENPNSSFCGRGEVGWKWRPNKKVTDEVVRTSLAAFEKSAGKTFPKVARVFPHLELVDVGLCYPTCENGTDSLLLG